MNLRLPRIVTVMQTRMGSSRLPGKVLLPLQGRALFLRQADRIMAASLHGKLVVATTTDPADDVIESICRRENIACYRGHPADVLDRHYQAGKQWGADVVLKIPSDCPLIDPTAIDLVIRFFVDHHDALDYASNLHPATWPDGNDVEVMPMAVLETAWREATKDFEREHTTPYIWERPEQFRLGNVVLPGGGDYSLSHRWTIDYQEDYAFIRTVFDELYIDSPFFGTEEILRLLNRRPDIYEINHHLAGVNWYRNHLGQLKTIDASKTKPI